MTMENTIRWVTDYYYNSFRSLEDDIAALSGIQDGVVVLTKDFSVLARRVNSKEHYKWTSLWEKYDTTDAWYIHLMAGSLEKAYEAFKDLPKEKYVVFHRGKRNDKAHIVPTEALLKNIVKISV